MNLAQNLVVNDRYKVIKKLGTGSYSTVWKVEDLETNIFYALKVISHKWNQIAKNEIDLLEKLKDKENVIQLIDNFILDKISYIVLELYEMTLEEYLKNDIDYEIKIEILRKIIIGLKYFEELGIIHGDLKPYNILINEKDLKIAICDLSLSHEFCHIKRGKILQTAYYRSPEAIFGSIYDKNIDLWSLGCIIVEIFIGMRLFDIHKYCSFKKNDLPDILNDFNEEMILLNMFEKVLGKMPYEYYRYALYSNYYLILNNNKSYQLIYGINHEMKNINEIFDDFNFEHDIKEIVCGLLKYESSDRLKLNNILEKIDF